MQRATDVAVQVVNYNDVPISAELSSPFGAETIATIGPGRAEARIFQATVEAMVKSVVTVRVTAAIGGSIVALQRHATIPANSFA